MVTAAEDRAFLGHPRGLAYLAFTEAWERFSFYGMQTLLMLYMVGELLQPGQVDNVLGFAAFRGLIEGVLGPLTPIALGSIIFGLYSSFAYFLPVFGGLVGDRLLGQYRCVLLGAVLMSLGHLLMVFPAFFLVSLLLLIVGAGFLKGNINIQVGRLYAPDDRRRTDAYQIFTLGINVGVVLAPFVCGTLGEVYGWHYGFGVAGIGMLIGLGIYVAGRRHLPPDRLVKSAVGVEKPRLEKGDGKTIAALLAVLVVITLYLAATGQTGSIYLVWVKDNIDRTAFGYTLPVTWLLSVTAFISILLPAGLLRFWQWQAARGSEPGMLTKIGFGCGLAGAACLVLALLARVIEAGGVVAWPWLLIHHLIVAVGYLFIWPVGMALFSRAAPAAISATIIGIYFLSHFISHNFSGWLGSLYEQMAPSQFWLLHAAIGLAGGVFLLIFGRPLSAILTPKPAKPLTWKDTCMTEKQLPPSSAMVGTRRGLIAAAAALAALPVAARAAVTPVTSDGPLPNLHGAWRRMFARPDDQVFVWWMSGLMTVHVDGLREFPVARSHAVMVCRASAISGDETAVDWRMLGYLSHLDTGLPLERWYNVFTGKTEMAPTRFERGPARYVAKASADGASLSLTEADTRVVRSVLSGTLAEGRALLEQNESRIQGFPGMDGRLPAVDSPDVTEVQTRLSFIAPAAEVAAGSGALAGHGYFSQVYDGLPAWLGFGARLGGTPVKGALRKAAADEAVDPAVWTQLRRLHPAAFAGDRLKLA